MGTVVMAKASGAAAADGMRPEEPGSAAAARAETQHSLNTCSQALHPLNTLCLWTHTCVYVCLSTNTDETVEMTSDIKTVKIKPFTRW